MIWSKEKPTHPGWYWYRSIVCETTLYTRVVEVFPDGKVCDGSLLPMDHIDKCQGEWAGPIPEPEEVNL